MEPGSIPVQLEASEFVAAEEPPGDERLAEIWHAAEALVSPILAERRRGLERLVELRAGAHSTLVAYLLTTRIAEPDIPLRAQVIKALADILSSEAGGLEPDEGVCACLASGLAEMRTRRIFALLQVVDYESSMAMPVAALLKACSFAGHQLSSILMDRQLPLAIRKQAISFVAEIGYLDAAPALERLAARMEPKRTPGRGSTEPLPGSEDETTILPLVYDALSRLRAP